MKSSNASTKYTIFKNNPIVGLSLELLSELPKMGLKVAIKYFLESRLKVAKFLFI